MKDELKNKLLQKKAAQGAVKQEYKDKEKVKKLTTDERLTRLERLIGIE